MGRSCRNGTAELLPPDQPTLSAVPLGLTLLMLVVSHRLESGNSIEEKLLKNGTKDLIREVAAQGTDYTLAFLTQVNKHD